jgi:uncharacterized protein YecT (DUF1311 family)
MKQKKQLILAGCLIYFFFSVVFALESFPKDWRGYIQEGLSNMEMQDRAIALQALLDRDIQKQLDLMLKEARDDTERELLKVNQKAWEKFARSKADYIADNYRGGSLESMLFGYELLEESLRRVQELKAMKIQKDTP